MNRCTIWVHLQLLVTRLLDIWAGIPEFLPKGIDEIHHAIAQISKDSLALLRPLLRTLH
ncbi:MAG: hypothetical protein ACLFQP_00585 [Halothece sp.]